MPIDSSPVVPRLLQRLGTYSIPEVSPAGPVPARGLSPDFLMRLWRELLAHHAKAVGLQDRPAPPDAWSDDTFRQWRYELKIEIKTLEAIAALLHGLFAPGLPPCDVACPHVAAGLDSVALQRYLASLEAYAAACVRVGREESYVEADYARQSARAAQSLLRGQAVERREAVKGVEYVLTRHLHSSRPEEDTFTLEWTAEDGRPRREAFADAKAAWACVPARR